jgi:hypothetical protein
MKIPRDQISVARVLSEDDDFLVLEVGKHDNVTFTLQKDEDGETIGGDRFLTVLFIHHTDDGAEVWKPWEDVA